MPKLHIDVNEWYPVLTLTKTQGFDYEAAEFTDEELADLRRVSAEWWNWQTKIAERFGCMSGTFDYDLVREDVP